MEDQALQKKGITAQEFQQYLASDYLIRAIRDVLPSHKKKDMERILRIALMEFKNNENLHTCSLNSIGKALMDACRLGLEVGSLTGHAYLIPYWDNKNRGHRCTLQIGYKGLLELAYRTGSVLSVSAMTVYQNDEFEVMGGTERGIRHKICLGEKGAVTGYYIVVDLQNTRPVFHYMSVQDIDEHKETFLGRVKKVIKGPDGKDIVSYGQFWDKFPDQMAYKTIFIKLFKWLPNNTFLKDVSEIEASAYGGSIEGEVVSCESKASRVAEAITDESQEQEGILCEDYQPEYDQQYPYAA